MPRLFSLGIVDAAAQHHHVFEPIIFLYGRGAVADRLEKYVHQWWGTTPARRACSRSDLPRMFHALPVATALTGAAERTPTPIPLRFGNLDKCGHRRRTPKRSQVHAHVDHLGDYLRASPDKQRGGAGGPATVFSHSLSPFGAAGQQPSLRRWWATRARTGRSLSGGRDAPGKPKCSFSSRTATRPRW